MRIVKKGVAKEWSVTTTCTGKGNGGVGCGATLLVGYSDLFTTASHAYDGSSEYYTTFKCPQCLALTDIHPRPPRSSSLPDQIQHAADKLKKTAKENASDALLVALQDYQDDNRIGNDRDSELYKNAEIAMKAYKKFSS